MKGKHGSFLAVLKDGRHVTHAGQFADYADFKAFVRQALENQRNNLAKFYYAWGGESQEYTPGEVLEVFFGE